jgi:putative hemolysin
MSHTIDDQMVASQFSPATAIRFSYARDQDPTFRKLAIRAIEILTGQRKLKRAYLDWSGGRQGRENIFAAGIRRLDITLDFDCAAHAAIPATGTLLIVAIHPYGVADGMALGDLITRVRPDMKIMTHSLLCQPPEANQFLLPVDFAGTAAARQRSAGTRLDAQNWLKAGHCVALFPAGGVATRQKPLTGPALDLPWHSFAGKLAALPGVRTVPLFFHGQNSTLFHLASHTHDAMRIALLFRETLRQAGRTMSVSIGRPLSAPDLPIAAGRNAVAEALRHATYALCLDAAPGAAIPYVWPSHVKF